MTTVNKKSKMSECKPKADLHSHHYSFNLNDADNAKFLFLFEESELKDKAHSITSCIFKQELKVVKVDKAVIGFITFA
ncbi:hypothetical protein EZS27_018168 [termite gut metagenome]|uniref:Uncharacterized protein n=1 Tax=termite gut metagenome TaxID=433724 RepID=A0A5J4RGY0_9ZZZZ